MKIRLFKPLDELCNEYVLVLTVYNRHKRSMFNKLGVDKAAMAIHKAHVDGVI